MVWGVKVMLIREGIDGETFGLIGVWGVDGVGRSGEVKIGAGRSGEAGGNTAVDGGFVLGAGGGGVGRGGFHGGSVVGYMCNLLGT